MLKQKANRMNLEELAGVIFIFKKAFRLYLVILLCDRAELRSYM